MWREVGSPSGRAAGECGDISQRRDRTSVPLEMGQDLSSPETGRKLRPSLSPQAPLGRGFQRDGPGAKQRPWAEPRISRGERGSRGRSEAQARRGRGRGCAAAVARRERRQHAAVPDSAAPGRRGPARLRG